MNGMWVRVREISTIAIEDFDTANIGAVGIESCLHAVSTFEACNKRTPPVTLSCPSVAVTRGSFVDLHYNIGRSGLSMVLYGHCEKVFLLFFRLFPPTEDNRSD